MPRMVWALKFSNQLLIASFSLVVRTNDLVEVVNNSTTAMHNLAQPVYENDERKVDFYQWNAFLSKYFKTLPGISKYYHFLFESEHPGYIKYKRCHSDDFRSYNCLLKDLNPKRIFGFVDLATQNHCDNLVVPEYCVDVLSYF